MKAALVAVPRCRVQEIRASREKLAKVVPAERELQIPRLPPDFLSGLVASVKPRAAFLKESRIRGRWLVPRVGNPEFARDDKVEVGDFYKELLLGWITAALNYPGVTLRSLTAR